MHGVSFDRLKMLLNTVAEISLRLTGLLPQHAARLTELATLVRGGRAARSRTMQQHDAPVTGSGRDLLDIDIERVLPLDDTTVTVAHLILASSLTRYLLVGKLALQPTLKVQGVPAQQCPPDQMLMLPKMPAALQLDDRLLLAPEFVHFKSFVDSVVSPATAALPVGMAPPLHQKAEQADVPVFLRFLPEDMCPPVVLHTAHRPNLDTDPQATPLTARLFTPSGGAAAGRGGAGNNLSPPWHTFADTSPLRALLTEPGHRVVSAPPFASLVFQRLFWNGKLAVTPPRMVGLAGGFGARAPAAGGVGAGYPASRTSQSHTSPLDAFAAMRLGPGLGASEHEFADVRVAASATQVEINAPKPLSAVKFTLVGEKKGKPVRLGSHAVAASALTQLHWEVCPTGAPLFLEPLVEDAAVSDDDSDSDDGLRPQYKKPGGKDAGSAKARKAKKAALAQREAARQAQAQQADRKSTV